ncbi:MAG: hypothetical protein R8M37_02840 [Alphaproteobacteria bacterium]|nr:hypothetical protein [Alphaproteobacteria bacterium]
MRFFVVLILCMFMGVADAVVKCIKASGTIKHGGRYDVPSAYSNNGADWSNTVHGISYFGVSRFENGICYCKIISPVITEWVHLLAPTTGIDNCSNSCASAINGSITYTIIASSTGYSGIKVG